MSFTPFLQLPIALVALALVIVPAVVAHELGHLLAALALKVPVSTFSVGFGPELLGRTSRSGIRFKLSAIPLGGYVSFAPPSTPSSTIRVGTRRLGFDVSLPGEDGFSRAAPWRRLVVLLAGPAASLAFAALVFLAAALAYGVPAPGVDVVGVEDGGPAAVAGIRAGDHLVSVAGDVGERTILERIAASAGRGVTIVLRRGAETLDLEATVGTKVLDTPLGRKAIGRLGIGLAPAPRRFDPGAAVSTTFEYVGFLSSATLGFFGDVAHGKASMNDMSSPVGIAAVSGRLLQRNLELFFRFAGAVSFGLGVTNLLPIPALDGGQSVLAILEMATRRRLSRVATASLSLGGMVLALGFILFVMAGELGAVLDHAFSH